MVTVSGRLRSSTRRRIEREQLRLLAVGLAVAALAAAVLALLCGMAAQEIGGAPGVLPVAAAEPTPTAEETPLVIPMDSSLFAPVSLPLEELIKAAQTPAPTPGPRYPLTEAERDLVERVVMAEAGGEDYDGKCLVAQCILNTCEARGMTPVETITEKNQYAAPAEWATPAVRDAVAAVFDAGYTVTSEPVRWFYAPRHSAGTWHENNLVFVLEHGGHKFFKEAGK